MNDQATGAPVMQLPPRANSFRPVGAPPQSGDVVADAATGAPVVQLPPRADAAPTEAAAAPSVAPAEPQGWSDRLGGLAAALFDGGRQGAAIVAGAPG